MTKNDQIEERAIPVIKKKPLPRGILLIGLILLSAGVILTVTSISPNLRDPNIPSTMYLFAAFYFFLLGWGLLRLYRWAWYATIIAMAMSAYFISQYAPLSNPGISLGFLGAIGVYLLLPTVRNQFLKKKG